MLDRALALLGIALALIFGVWSLAPEGWPKLPSAAIFAGFAFGVFSIGLAIGLIIGERRKTDRETTPKVIETNLFLQFSDNHTPPVEKSPRNIRHWFASFSDSIKVDMQDVQGRSQGGFSVPPRWVVFMIFEKSPRYRQMVADCRGPNCPHATIHAANTEYAVISINGNVTNATLDISLIR